MRRFCWLVVFGVGVLLLPAASAEAQGALQITGQGSTHGTFTITNPLAWATYSQLVIAFKTGQGQQNPGTTNPPDPLPAVPEPATLILLGSGLALAQLRRSRSRRRRLVDV